LWHRNVSWEIAVNMTTSLRVRRSEVRIPVVFQIASGASVTELVPRALSAGSKRLGQLAGHLPATGIEVQNEWNCTATPSIRLRDIYIYMCVCVCVFWFF